MKSDSRIRFVVGALTAGSFLLGATEQATAAPHPSAASDWSAVYAAAPASASTPIAGAGKNSLPNTNSWTRCDDHYRGGANTFASIQAKGKGRYELTIGLQTDNPAYKDALFWDILVRVYVNRAPTNWSLRTTTSKRIDHYFHSNIKIQGRKLKVDKKNYTIGTGDDITFQYNIQYYGAVM